jgi:hypothetical protein
MEQAGPQIATRHHTQDAQTQTTCRMLAKIALVFLDELDETDDVRRLRRLVDDLALAGQAEGFDLGRVLRLVPPPG